MIVSLVSVLGQDLMSTHRGDWMFPLALVQSRLSGRVGQIVSVGRGGVLMQFEAEVGENGATSPL